MIAFNLELPLILVVLLSSGKEATGYSAPRQSFKEITR
jgi:hypothetical protein